MQLLDWKTILLIFAVFHVVVYTLVMLVVTANSEGELYEIRTEFLLGQITGYGILFIIIPASIAKAIKKVKARKSNELERLK